MNGASSLMRPATPSPTTQLLSTAIQQEDCCRQARRDSQPGIKDVYQKISPITSRSSGVDSRSPLESSQKGVESYQESRSRSKASRNRSSRSSSSSNQYAARTSKHSSQKLMLSKALQKANSAVLLDNAQNFEGAMQAYSEACGLLNHVMSRSSGNEDRRKLEAIHITYTIRISELEKISLQLDEFTKALPAQSESSVPLKDDEEIMTHEEMVNEHSCLEGIKQHRSMSLSQLPPRRESLQVGSEASAHKQDSFKGRSCLRSPIETTNDSHEDSMNNSYMPRPLSPRRPTSPKYQENTIQVEPRQLETKISSTNNFLDISGHSRMASKDSSHWLDTIDEAGSSATPSIHSRSSSLKIYRKPLQALKFETEVEFDAALDAAIEAAYDDGLMPIYSTDFSTSGHLDDEIVANVRRKVELAKERVRQSEREAAVQIAHERERIRIQQQHLQDVIEDGYDSNESEEEERILEEMTRDYAMENFDIDLYGGAALLRETELDKGGERLNSSSLTSGSSNILEGYSKLQNSSISKNPTPDLPLFPRLSEVSLPEPSERGSSCDFSTSGVRTRRLSGQRAKPLKIETNSQLPVDHRQDSSQAKPSNTVILAPLKSLETNKSHESTPNTTDRPPTLQIPRQTSQPLVNSTDTIPSFTNSPQRLGNDVDPQSCEAESPTRTKSRISLRKNASSTSLKNIKSRNVSTSNLEEGSDTSLNTPVSIQFNEREVNSTHQLRPNLLTPLVMSLTERQSQSQNKNMDLFNNSFHSQDNFGMPSSTDNTTPTPLESCPTEYLLRPFWLMRALYQTIVHPKGGFITNKLFVPCDVWRVKGVKIKNMEDKIANCEVLTSALTKLARVDSFDADAVLDEMQTFESVLEQVQAVLSKKLGSEVGVQNSGNFPAFKDTFVEADNENNNTLSKTGTISSKSSFSWRRLRSKNSGVSLSSTYSNKTHVDPLKECPTIPTLPMASSITKKRSPRSDVNKVQFSGPNANYMSALARLFDAAQTVGKLRIPDLGMQIRLRLAWSSVPGTRLNSLDSTYVGLFWQISRFSWINLLRRKVDGY
ncbi:hypothetical protein BGHDH14_bgh04850 [Blumeria hordei DH14]|uniref:MIT domain-containing protein n=1 Tax=Blumeria graminis f. sp. hordei (strain DH14) TaxID=546991 RepID=N1JBU4_BLUG1|nr:hypothetical protein BGHDH14_bgh04850 [Blumeria hordei DH14]